ncbi:MAG TPA: hypothetical protein VLA48_06630 [Nitrososphaeraceae archaeon]|nr:hypothetical protein [Nitrososphaeraceae archaeon]
MLVEGVVEEGITAISPTALLFISGFNSIPLTIPFCPLLLS